MLVWSLQVAGYIFMGQTPVYRHISDLDNNDKRINRIEAN